MNSEKVKEIKIALQDHSIYKLKYQDGIKIKEIGFIDILTLINELEAENEIFLESKTMWKRLHTEVCEENQQLKGRIDELGNKIKHGTLVELPCKVGDTLYFLQYYCDSRGCSKDKQSYCCGCKEMITRERNNKKYIIATKNCKWSDLPIIGEIYFVTREEAEAKLKKLQEEHK